MRGRAATSDPLPAGEAIGPRPPRARPPESDRAFVRDVIGWDVVNWSRALSFWQRHAPVPLAGARALELGCGPRGGLSLWLAARGSHVVCSDLRRPPAPVRRFHGRFALPGSITYEAVDALRLDRPEAFDLVVYKSVLGGIVGRGSLEVARRVVDGIHASLRPGGALLLVENLASTRLHMALRNRYGRGGRDWRYFTVEELVELHAPFRRFRYRTDGFLGCFGVAEPQRALLGHLDRLLCPLLPEPWHYLLAGVAEK